MSELELFNVLTRDRTKLLDYLAINGSYDELKGELMKIEDSNADVWDIVQRLFLGKHGMECNKQMAFYELPTLDLVQCISMICEQLGIFKIEEIGAGTGLLSGMLNRLTNLDVNATDGKTWMETNVTLHPVQQKLFLEYALDNIDYDDKLIILSWISNKAVNDIDEIIKMKKFRQFIIIGEQYNKYIHTTNDTMLENGYQRIVIPVKQLCYNDYFRMNHYYPENCIRSSCTLYIRDDVEEINVNIADPPNVLTDITDYMVIQDMITFGILPKWVMTVLTDHDLAISKKVIIDIEKFISNGESNKTMIFKVINSLEHFRFWISKPNFPKITTNEKFIEYYELCTSLNSPNGLTNLKHRSCLPQWINTKDEAEKYLYLDFSSTSKKWKESREMFMIHYRSNTSMNHYLTGSIFGL